MNRGFVKCYGCGSAIRWVDAYIMNDKYYCEACVDRLIKDSEEGTYFKYELKGED